MTDKPDLNAIPKTDQIDSLDPKKTKIVIGLTGGVDSTAAAYVLKKRGFHCIGLSMIFYNKEKILSKINELPSVIESKNINPKIKGQKVKVLDYSEFLKSTCNIESLENVQKICKILDIPFYAVNAHELFETYVFENMVASKIGATNYNPCVSCNSIKVRILLEKAEILGAHFVATGHYAKVYQNKIGKHYEIYSSNDAKSDQSYLLSDLEQKYLSRLIFPLSDLRKEEVNKIVNKYKLPGQVQRDSTKVCFMNKTGMAEFVETKAHVTLCKDGAFHNLKTGTQMSDHLGIHRYWVGQKEVEGKFSKAHLLGIDKSLLVAKIEPRGKIYLGDKSFLTYEGCGLSDVHFGTKFDQSIPINIFFRYTIDSPLEEAQFFFKNNDSGVLQYARPIFGQTIGQHITFYSSKEPGARVLGSGKISYLGPLDLISRSTGAEEKEVDKYGNEVPAKVKELKF